MKFVSTTLNFVFMTVFGLVKLVAAGLFNQKSTNGEQKDLIKDHSKNFGQHDHNVILDDDGYKL